MSTSSDMMILGVETSCDDTAIGSGFRLPLVMSTSINPNEVFGSKISSNTNK